MLSYNEVCFISKIIRKRTGKVHISYFALMFEKLSLKKQKI